MLSLLLPIVHLLLLLLEILLIVYDEQIVSENFIVIFDKPYDINVPKYESQIVIGLDMINDVDDDGTSLCWCWHGTHWIWFG